MTTGAASRPGLWWGLAVAVLVLGYADLWRGGVTVAFTHAFGETA